MTGTDFVIADEHVLFRSGLRKLLETNPDFRVVAEAGTGQEAVQVVQRLSPALLLIDIDIKSPNVTDVLKKLGPSCSTRTILVASRITDSRILIENARILIEDSTILTALRLNARGLLLKDSTPIVLFESIRAVMSGQYWMFCTSVPDFHQVLGSFEKPASVSAARSPRFKLTGREHDILEAVVAGWNNKQIGTEFSISEQTVKHHVTSIFNKTGASNRLELAMLAIDNRLVDVSAKPRRQRERR